MTAVHAARWLREATADLTPGLPVAHVYRPLEYAWQVHQAYLEAYGSGRKRALLVGMNPGPWGMGQNGIPFGTISVVRDWLALGGNAIDQPARPIAKRPIQGWDCRREEVSGKRLWGFLRERYGTPSAALEDLLVVNHCPLLMFDATGKNVTPDKLRAADRNELLAVCDEGLERLSNAVGAEVLIGVGAYAEKRCQGIAAGRRVMRIPHPSPASPLANRNGGADWRKAVGEVFDKAGL